MRRPRFALYGLVRQLNQVYNSCTNSEWSGSDSDGSLVLLHIRRGLILDGCHSAPSSQLNDIWCVKHPSKSYLHW